MCPTGHFIDGWEAINSVKNGLTGLKFSCTSPAEKQAGLTKARTWVSTKTGKVDGALANHRFLHSTKYICGVEVTDRGLIGEQSGLEGSVVKYCDNVLTQDMTSKFLGVAYSSGAYGKSGNNSSMVKMWTDASRSGRQQLIVHRECSSCAASHKDIFYRRLRNPGKINPWSLFMQTWAKQDNNMNVDFKLYSTLDDALADRNAWKSCNYDDGGVGFPRDCGKTGAIGSQWNTAGTSRGQQDYRYSMYRIGAYEKILKFDKGENLTKIEEYYAGSDTLSKLVFHTSFGNELECADESDSDAYVLRKEYKAGQDQHLKHITQDSEGNIQSVTQEDI